MRLFTAILVVLTLAGCSSAEILGNSAPTFEAQSERPAKGVAACIADRWDNGISGWYIVSVRPTEKGLRVSTLNQAAGFVDNIADVDDRGSGSYVRYHTAGAPMDIPKFLQRVKDCV